MKACVKIDSYVINNIVLNDIVANSIGLVQALNGTYAMVFFVGVNQSLRVDCADLSVVDVEKTGKGYKNKICNICHILKVTADFSINQTDVKGIKTTRPSCIECRKNIDGVKLLNEEKKRMDKIKPPKNSVFVCPICQKSSIVSITAHLVKDHNHDTGIGREWICDSCNTGLGRFKDSVSFLERVIDYLKKHS